MDFSLTAEQKAIVEAVQKTCADFDDDYWRERDQTGEFPFDFHRAMADGGWLGIAMPEEYGGGGLGVTEAALVMHTVANSSGAQSAASAIHMNIFGPHPIVVFGNEEQKKKWRLSAAAIRDLLKALQILGAATGLTSEEVSDMTAQLQDALMEPSPGVEAGIEGDAIGLTSEEVSALTGQLQDGPMEPAPSVEAGIERADPERTVVDLSFSDTDRIYVQNSGLVILWPFLDRFFHRQGLTEGDILGTQRRCTGRLGYCNTSLRVSRLSRSTYCPSTRCCAASM